jgi:subtilase family serine protease/N-acetylneuraminic acid mutarotase
VAAAIASVAGLSVAAAPAPASAVTVTVTVTARTKPAGARSASATASRTEHAGATKLASDVRQACATPKQGHAACMSLVRTNVKAHKGLFAHDTTPPGYGPSDLQSAYNLPSSTAGSGETVAIVDAGGDPTAEADLATYRSQYGLPACTTTSGCFEQVNQEGQQGNYPPVDSGWPTEESLDLDMVSAVCPNCHILLVEADSSSNTDLFAAEDEAVTLGARYVSNSWAEPEQDLGSAAAEAQADASFNHPGAVITAAGGDNGYDNYQEGANSPNYPASSQYVTSVGGTTLTQDSSTARGWNETVWSPDPSATGSGCSLYEPKPAWQTDSGCSTRMTNDVSAVADPNTGVAIYDTTEEGGWTVLGGTSVATPIIASTYALAGSPAAGTYPSSYPYLNAGLNDVTSGTNYDQTCSPAYFCTARPGYDGPTGLGTPDGVSAFAPVGAGTIAGTVTAAATGKPVTGATVTVGSWSVTTSSTGAYSMVVAPGTYTVTVQAFGYAEKTISGVQVTQGQTTTQNAALATGSDVTVSGTVADGSGQGWPLLAKISISGDPKAVYTSPYTGKYSISVPGQTSYAMTVTPLYPGYATDTVPVTVGTSGVQQNAAVTVNTATCDAPGYASSAGTCSPVQGGLVAGAVTDANTGQPVNGATITGTAGQSGTSKKTADPQLRAGFYSLFASPPGPVTLTAVGTGYQAATASVTVASGTVTQQNWSLKAGQLAITPASLSATETLGRTSTQKIILTNNGSAPVQVSLGTQAGTFTPAGQPASQPLASSTPFRMIKGHFTPGPAGLKALANAVARADTTGSAGKPAGGWSQIASYPFSIGVNAAAYDPQTGEVYSLSGNDVDGPAGPSSDTAKSYVYDPATNTWNRIANSPQALYQPAAAFLDGRVYLIGGWATGQGGNWTPSAAVYAYAPGSSTWSQVASLPTAEGAPMAAVLGGQLYAIGGCTTTGQGSFCQQASDAVYRYDPATGTWATLASYPVPAGFGACAGLDGQVVCAGGRNATSNDLSATYLYDPVTNTWTQGADMPAVHGSGYWGMSYAGANGMLQMAGGVTDNGGEVTNEAQEYNPVTNTWNLLPNTNYPAFEEAGACGFYQIGGGASSTWTSAQVLAGYDQCDGAGDTPWLSEKDAQVTVPAGQSQTVSVRLDAAKVSQPGIYTAGLWAATNTPYPVQTIPVTLQVNPPAGWQEISGTVTGSSKAQIAGVTVTLGSASGKDVAATQTNGDGSYQQWLAAGRVQVTAAKNTYQPQATMITLKTGTPATVSFKLQPDPSTSPYQAASSQGPRPASDGKAVTTAKTAATGSAASKTSTGSFVRVCPAAKPGRVTCLALIRTDTLRYKGVLAPDATPAGYGPSDLQSAYNLPSATAGSGATVAIVGAYDDPAAASDLATYRKQYKLPACTPASGCFIKVNQNGRKGHYPTSNAGWAYNDTLGLDSVSAICPNCHLLLVEANTDTVASIGKAEDEAVALGAKYVDNPYGGAPEASQEAQFNKYFDHPGVAVTAAAGDNGYGVTFPAVAPDVTSVGGTTLTQDPETTRGWSETAWDDTGSGCSAYESKPAWQRDTGCQNRTDNDVAAVAGSPVAVYDSGEGGWVQAESTSVAASIIAGVYALAGTPIAGTYPASYPYMHAIGLNNITSGTDGTCTPAYLCTAGSGYNGPTGLGSPEGVSAFTPVSYGILTGTVTTAATGQPVAGATVTADGLAATTSGTGTYTLTATPGQADITASYYGYAAATASVQVTAGQTTTHNLTLATAAKEIVAGTVTDGSGHGWPLYAAITISGVPGAPAKTYYTSPYTGKYSIRLPGQNTYTLTVTPDYPGYAATTATVDLGTTRVQKSITIPVASLVCTQAPGYTFSPNGGVYQQFTGWSGATAQDGWANNSNNKSNHIWQFNSASVINQTGSNNFANADPSNYRSDTMNAALVSPVFALAEASSPTITFNTQIGRSSKFDASVDLSLDGGRTWQTVWQKRTTTSNERNMFISIPVPQAAGQSDVEVRFEFHGSGLSDWEIANVLVGTPVCAAIPGGLVAGEVTDANTGEPVNGATVTADAKPGGSETTAATGDPALPGGYYWLFSKPGAAKFTVTDGRYVRASTSVDVASNAVARQDWALKSGQVTADAHSLSATEILGHSGAAKVTFRNGGGAPVHVTFGTQADGFTPVKQAAGKASGTSVRPSTAVDSTPVITRPTGQATPASKWAKVTHLPTAVGNNAAAYDPQTGQVYSVGGGYGSPGGSPGDGFDCPAGGQTANAYAYDSSAKTWDPIASLPQPLQNSAAAFLNGTLYVAGGFNCSQEPSAAVYAYTPGANTWSQVASLPTALAGSAAAVLDGQLYVIGGCPQGLCAANSQVLSRAVYRYDPISNAWTKLAGYPVYQGVAFEACAGIDNEIVCAGGLGYNSGALSSTWLYNPASNTWTQGAGMPYPDFQMAYTGANGQLQAAGGVSSDDQVTSQASQYNPATNAWSSLPSLPAPGWGAGGACGMYVIGGGNSGSRTALKLPGYDQCDGAQDTGWLPAPRGFTLQPGQSVTVKVTLDAAQVDQPGTYTAGLLVATNTPYPVTVIPVTLTVKPPSGWGLLTGTVTDSKGKPIAGATVQVDTTCTAGDHCGKLYYTLTTTADGSWQWWLPTADNGLLVIAAKDGYVQQVTRTRVRPRQSAILNNALAGYQPPMQ